jgi:type VI secretion system VasI family protein
MIVLVEHSKPSLGRLSVNFLKMAIAAVGFALFPQVAVGDYFSAMEQCVTETTSAARMACVDAVTSEEDAQKRKGQQSYGGGGGGGGSRGPQKSAADSQKTLEYALRAETQIEGSSSSYRPTMVFRCAHGEMLGYVIVGLDVQPDRVSHSAAYTDAIFQVDQERAFRVELRVSNNGDRLYIPSTIEFSDRVFGKDRLTVRVTPYDAEPAETTFDIEHFEKGIAPLRKACRW